MGYMLGDRTMNYADWFIKVKDLLHKRQEYPAARVELQVPIQQKMSPTKAAAYVIQQREADRARWEQEKQDKAGYTSNLG
jgi:hypothetical protein